MKFLDDVKQEVNKKMIVAFSNNFNKATPEQKIMILSQMIEKTAKDTTEKFVKHCEENDIEIPKKVIEDWYND